MGPEVLPGLPEMAPKRLQRVGSPWRADSLGMSAKPPIADEIAAPRKSAVPRQYPKYIELTFSDQSRLPCRFAIMSESNRPVPAARPGNANRSAQRLSIPRKGEAAMDPA